MNALIGELERNLGVTCFCKQGAFSPYCAIHNARELVTVLEEHKLSGEVVHQANIDQVEKLEQEIADLKQQLEAKTEEQEQKELELVEKAIDVLQKFIEKHSSEVQITIKMAKKPEAEAKA